MDSEPRLYRLPDLDDPIFAVKYHQNHPEVVAAREYLRNHRKQKAPTNIDKETGENEANDPETYDVRSEWLKIWHLERFFNLQSNPPNPTMRTDDKGQIVKDRHPDLLEIEDPWYRQPEIPDLIDFDSTDFQESKLPDLVDFKPENLTNCCETTSHSSEVPDLIDFSSPDPE